MSTERPNAPITLLAESKESAEVLFLAVPDANVVKLPIKPNFTIQGLCAVCADDPVYGSRMAAMCHCKCVTPENAPTFHEMFDNELHLQRQHKLFAAHKPSDSQMKRGAYGAIRSLVMRSLTFIPLPVSPLPSSTT